MKKLFISLCVVSMATIGFAQQAYEWSTAKTGDYTYQYVKDDPLKTRFYTLKNGFTVIMSVNKDEPRLQTIIATKAGSNTDPANHTGLAHYLEHMLFKGTDKYGSLDWSKEKPYLDQIDDLYEQYNSTTDEVERAKIYAAIDSTSGIAAKYAIANEYDKLMSIIGAKGTNAFTWYEQTAYVNDIPANQISNWLTIESERFRNPVFRIFHTELEAVYEEKNRSLDNDEWKAQEVLLASLFPTHNYGQQTTIGTIEHLKNPSLKEIRKYYEKYYVPNNMCMVLAGDFDPDKVIKEVDEKFGGFVAKPVEPYKAPIETDITAPIEKTVYGPKDEWVDIAYRLPGANSKEAGLLQFIDRILANGTAGLIDININQQQKTLEAVSYAQSMKDYSMYVLEGKPKQGQTLEEVKSLLLHEMENLKKGNFDESLLQAVKNNFEKEKLQKMESNNNRAYNLLDAFIKNVNWKDELSFYEEIKSYNKQDVQAFANKWFGNNYVVVYKKTGMDSSVIKVEKPPIHEVEVNRNAQSDFVKMIIANKVEPITPVFANFKKDIQQGLSNKNAVYSVVNTENQLFTLYYYFEMGSNHIKKLPIALEYLNYLNTDRYSSEDLKKEFYKLATDYSTQCEPRTTTIQITGLNKNFAKSVELLEHLFVSCQPDQNKLNAFINDYIQARNNDKLSKGKILAGLTNIANYGIKNPYNNKLSDAELKKLRSEELVMILKNLTKYIHKILYYGPEDNKTLVSSLSMYHKNSIATKALPIPIPFKFRKLTTSEVNFAPYNMVQTEISWNRYSAIYNPILIPTISLFNEYFGSGMSGIVFQTIRESKALAYSTYAQYGTAFKKGEPNLIRAYVGCQSDKMNDAIKGMQELLDSLPYSEKFFEVSKTALKNNFATSRIIKQQLLFSFLDAQRHGINYDIREKTYKMLDKMTFSDINAFHKSMLSRKPYSLNIIGDEKRIDIAGLNKYGKVNKYTLQQIFGY
ncbi:MAG TPA: insulinase family protein [Chitinophagales bacterium]|nr:insulinase family protein [Chitinophagales bacterium]HNF17937.1 insulinase family protein [Chitinophagales bacterium]HNG70388.1 insulinase family protein [Chitinophagales bacterium]HNJ00179.1 insulinase family protein [Chitinophagales bacterium]HNK10594.1 insulinase family protein [Chitinophagales bacterium]